VKPDQDATAPGASADADVPAIEVSPAADHASPKAFVIDDPVGTLDIDFATATNGLIQAAQAPGQVGTTGGGNGLSIGGGLGASPGNSGGAPGNSGSGGVAAGHTGILPATATSVAQLVASPGSQGNNGNGKGKSK
jgi:hypothetical protein